MLENPLRPRRVGGPGPDPPPKGDLGVGFRAFLGGFFVDCFLGVPGGILCRAFQGLFKVPPGALKRSLMPELYIMSAPSVPWVQWGAVPAQQRNTLVHLFVWNSCLEYSCMVALESNINTRTISLQMGRKLGDATHHLRWGNRETHSLLTLLPVTRPPPYSAPPYKPPCPPHCPLPVAAHCPRASSVLPQLCPPPPT